MKQTHSPYDYDPTKEAKPRLIGQLAPDDPIGVALEPGERLDIFTGSLSAQESAADNDPRAFSVINLQDAPRDGHGAIVYDGHRLSPHLQYLIIQPGVPIDWQKNTGYKGLRKGEVVDMGRHQDPVKDRFAFSSDTSRNHFTLAVDNEGGLMVADNQSLNGTAYRTAIDKPDDTATEAEATDTAAIEASPEDPERAYYRRLFSLPNPQGKDRFGNDMDRRLKVTEQSAEDAVLAFRYSDADVKTFVKEAARERHKDAWRDEDMAGILYEDEELRVDLGMHLLEKIKTLSYLPSRFYGTATKNPNYVGYRNMTSHEYAAVLALSMLDGTFKAPSSGDPIESDYGDIVRGQHRYAAMMLLGIQQSPLANIERIR